MGPASRHPFHRASTFFYANKLIRLASSNKHCVKRVKSNDLDNLLILEKNQKMALRMKDILSEGKCHNVGQLRHKMGLSSSKRLAFLAATYPRVFNIIKDEDSLLWMELRDEVQNLLDAERRYRKDVHEPVLVEALRKLLMMSANWRLSMDKLCQLNHEFGLPDDFRTNLVHKYPQFFRVLDEGSNGTLLELIEWDPSLAVTARERQIKEGLDDSDNLIGEHTDYGFRIGIPNGYTRRKKLRESIDHFQNLPFPSPYDDARGLGQNILELEKRTVALVHEFLSLTLQKRAVANHILLFRKELRLPQQVQALLLQHQGIFYVSLKGDVYTLFLKQAYEGSTLKERSPLIDFNSRFAELCMIRKEDKIGSNVD
ncbi:hypothetical protein O6H91_20G071300 [Diphasiastrum complanatum]|uniref:Uncharacterized protein n=1 Tax=Diphasiastrum complanatum TaxID=34168 RepID=A0ACC2ARM6_DIPCM|nr:hypothetical protein O6H91_20G071300 [Diphasiastrum complanatum]